MGIFNRNPKSSEIISASMGTAGSPSSIPSKPPIIYDTESVRNLIDAFRIPSAEDVWGGRKNVAASVIVHEVGHVGEDIRQGVMPSAIGVPNILGSGARGVVIAKRGADYTPEKAAFRARAGEAAAFALSKRTTYELNAAGAEDFTRYVQALYPDIAPLTRKEIDTQYTNSTSAARVEQWGNLLSEWQQTIEQEGYRIRSNPEELSALHEMANQVSANRVWISNASQNSIETFKNIFNYTPSEALTQNYAPGEDLVPMPAQYRSAMMDLAKAVGSPGVFNTLTQQTQGVEEALWSAGPSPAQSAPMMGNIGGLNFGVQNPNWQGGMPNYMSNSYTQSSTMGLDPNDYIYAGGNQWPKSFGGQLRINQSTNAIYDAQQHLLQGMDPQRAAGLSGPGGQKLDPDINEAVVKLNKTFKELSESMGQTAQQTTSFRQVIETVSDQATKGSIAAHDAIQMLQDVGIDPSKVIASYGGGGGGGGQQPPGVPEPGVPGQGKGGFDISSLLSGGRGGMGLLGEIGRSYYAMRAPYREFVEPVMQDIQAYGKTAGTQFSQLASYGLGQGAYNGAYAQFANMQANQQFAQMGAGRAATMAYANMLGSNQGQNENLNYIQGVLGPALGVGVAAGMATGNPLVGIGVAAGAAALGTASYGINALQDPYTAGRMYAAAGQNGGMYTTSGFGAAFAQNSIAALTAGMQNGGIQGINVNLGINQGTSVTGQLNRPAIMTPDQLRQEQYGNIVQGFMNQNLAQVQTPLGGYGPPNQGPLSGQQISVGATMLANNASVFDSSGLDATSRLSIANQVVSAYGLQGTNAGQGLMDRQNIIAANMAQAQAAGIDVNKSMSLYTTGAGGNQYSTIGTGAYGQALDTSSAWIAKNPQAAGVLQQFAPQIYAAQQAAISQGVTPTSMEDMQAGAKRVAFGGVEDQRLYQRGITRDTLTPGLMRQIQLSGYDPQGINAPEMARNMLGSNGYGDLGAQMQGAQSLLTYGAPTQESVVSAGALYERGFNAQAIMANRVLGMGMNAAAPGALTAAQTAVGQFNGMTNAQVTVQSQAEAQAAQINLGYGAYNNMNVGNYNKLTAGFAQQPADAARFGALVSGNAIAWSQQIDMYGGQNGVNKDWRTVQTGSQGGTAGMQAGYDEKISADQQNAIMARNVGQGYIRGDGRSSISQIASMNQKQRDAAAYGLQIESREEGFAYESANLARSRYSQLTQRGFEDTGIALQRTQQDWGRYIQGQQIGIQGAQMQANYAYQGTQMNIQRSHQVTQEGWQQQDLAYQRNVNELQYGYNMIDSQEDIRYSTGRQRRVAMRHQQEATVMFSMQEGQQTKEEQRATQQRQWSEQQFTLDKQHFEQEHQFELQNFELTKQDYQKQGEFIREQRSLEDQERTFNRQIQDEQFAADKTHLLVTQDIKRSMDDLTGVTTLWNQQVAEAKANMAYQTQTGTITNYTPVASAPPPPQQNTAVVSYSIPDKYGGGTITQSARNALATPSPGSHGVLQDLGGIAGMPMYDEGGYTGMGRKNLAVGTVHAGEHVVPQGGSLVYSNPEMIRVLQAIHSTLQQIHKDGGNAVININQGTPANAMKSAQSLYQKAYAQ